MSILQKYVYIIILLCWIPFALFSQEVKLGLPVGHSDFLRTAQFSPDGNNIVTVSSDGTDRVWDVPTGKNLQIL